MFEKVEAEFFIRGMRRIDLDEKYNCYALPGIQLDLEESVKNGVKDRRHLQMPRGS